LYEGIVSPVNFSWTAKSLLRLHCAGHVRPLDDCSAHVGREGSLPRTSGWVNEELDQLHGLRYAAETLLEAAAVAA